MNNIELYPPPERAGEGADVFIANFHLVSLAYKDAFAGPPWNENLPLTEVVYRLSHHMAKPGFNAILAIDDNRQIAGGLWYDTPSLEGLERTNREGRKLRRFAEGQLHQYGRMPLIWEREVIVHPDAQGQGVGTRLRESFLARLQAAHPAGSLVLTRMRDDNAGILAIAQKPDIGYQRVGIPVESTTKPGTFHDYWYKRVLPQPAE